MSITLNGDTGILVPANAEIEVGTNNGLSSPEANKIAINTNGTQRLIVDDSGNVGVGTGTPAMALDVSGQMRASSGILFGTDTAAANTLDDYEEGTWTPRLSGTTGGEYAIGTNNAGFYTKVGNLVSVGGTLSWASVVTAYSGLLVILNLPFAANATTNFRAVGAISVQFPTGVYAGGSYTDLAFSIDPGTNYAYIMQKNETITSGNNYNHIPSVNSTGSLSFSITYIV